MNLAARFQGEAKSGELVVEESLADRAIDRKMLLEAFVVSASDAKLKGVPTPVRVQRIRLAEALSAYTDRHSAMRGSRSPTPCPALRIPLAYKMRHCGCPWGW